MSVTQQRISVLEIQLEGKGYQVEYGKIGNKSTYCLISKGEEEYVGYTYVKDLSNANENIGKLKALNNAISHLEARNFITIN